MHSAVSTTVLGVFGFAIILLLGLFLSHGTSVNRENIRKVMHILSGVWFFILVLYRGEAGPHIVTAVLFTAVTVAAHFDGRLLSSVHNTGRRSYGQVFFGLTLILIALFSDNYLSAALVAIYMMTFPDAIAALVGKRLNGPTLRVVAGSSKTVAGTMAFIVSSVVGLLILRSVVPEYGSISLLGSDLLAIVLIAVLAATAEVFSVYGSDNLTVPVVSYLAVVGLASL